MSDISLESLVDLRLQLHALHPGARRDEAARRAIADFLRPGFEAVQRGEGQLLAWPKGDALRAAVLAWPIAQAWHGSSAFQVVVSHMPGDAEAVAWSCDAIDGLGRPLDFDLELDAHLPELRAHLLRTGLGIDSVTLLGAPGEALRRLPPAPPLPDDIACVPLAAAHVPEIVALYRDFFSAHPQFCWFGSNPAWLLNLSRGLQAAVTGPGLHEVLLRGDTVLGHWGTEFHFHHPLWGHKAGMSIVLHPELQGRGLVKRAYHRLLGAQVEAGIEVFRGGTSQPAVMALSRRMGRSVYGWWLRHQDRVYFEPEYFDLISPSDTPARPAGAGNPGPD